MTKTLANYAMKWITVVKSFMS